LPLESFRIDGNHLAFDDLSAQHGFSQPSQYKFTWFRWINEASRAENLTTSDSTALPDALASDAAGSYISCRITHPHQDRRAVTVYFRNENDNWRLVGVSRTAANGVS